MPFKDFLHLYNFNWCDIYFINIISVTVTCTVSRFGKPESVTIGSSVHCILFYHVYYFLIFSWQVPKCIIQKAHVHWPLFIALACNKLRGWCYCTWYYERSCCECANVLEVKELCPSGCCYIWVHRSCLIVLDAIFMFYIICISVILCIRLY